MQPSPGSFILKANIADALNGFFFFGEIEVADQRIRSVINLGEPVPGEIWIVPGFVDAHVHVESSMLVPSAFAQLAALHGTVATVSDPHEIANVCGMKGVQFMLDNAASVPFKFCFGAPSCVPATIFETSGATLSATDVAHLLKRDDIGYLSEVMNYPGVLNGDADLIAKINAAKAQGKPVDGHAPGLRSEDAARYIAAGITTDHECFTYAEAREKLEMGMKVLIREGSAAKNFDALIPLLAEWPDRMMFCSDDKHPDELKIGHINLLCARAVAAGIPVEHVLKAACVNPVLHYQLPAGLLQIGHAADFVQVKDLISFEVVATYIDGSCVASEGLSLITHAAPVAINNFAARKVEAEHFIYTPSPNHTAVPVVEALDKQIVTGSLWVSRTDFITGKDESLEANEENDLVKLVVVNRYNATALPAVSFIKNTGLKQGAIAGSIAHDSHNVVAMGTSDTALAAAINAVMDCGGGISAVRMQECEVDSIHCLELPVAGLMSVKSGYEVGEAYARLDAFAKEELHATLTSPFMTLSFMCLLVIPNFKLSDKGLFDGKNFTFV